MAVSYTHLDVYKRQVSKLSKKELKDWIGRLEKEMRQAGKELDFERAAELRDLMLEMRAQLV